MGDYVLGEGLHGAGVEGGVEPAADVLAVAFEDVEGNWVVADE